MSPDDQLSDKHIILAITVCAVHQQEILPDKKLSVSASITK